MPKILSFLLLIITIFQASYTHAMSFSDFNEEQLDIILNYESYTVANGLSQNTVTSIVEDSEGYVWIGTVNGINRFDGVSFKQYFFNDEKNGLPSSFIRNLLIDDSGQLIVGTDRGLVFYNKDKDIFYQSNNIHNIWKDAIWSTYYKDGYYYIGTDNNLYIFNSLLTKPVKHYYDEKIKEIKKIRVKNDTIIIRNYDNEIIQINKQKITLKQTKVFDFEILNNKIISSKHDGIYINGEFKDTLPKEINTMLINNKENSIQAFSKDSIFRIINLDDEFTTEKIGSFEITQSPNGQFTTNIGDGKIFISNLLDGFKIISTQNNLAKKLKLDIKKVWSITNDEKKIYIANGSGEVSVLNKDLKIIAKIKTPTIQGHKTISVIKNNLYIGSSSGLYIYDLVTNITNKVSNENLIKISTNHSNGISASSIDGKILKFNFDGSLESVFDTQTNHPIYDFIEDSERLLIASQKGLLSYNKTTKKTNIIFDSDFVFSILINKDNIFLGTRSGIYALNKSSNRITEVLRTNKTIYSVNFLDDIIIAPSNTEINFLDTSTEKTYTINEHNGTQEDYSTQSMVTYGSSVLIGGLDGLTVLSPKDLINKLNNDTGIKVDISEISIFNEKINVGEYILDKPLKYKKGIKLKNSDYPFSLSFNVTGFNSERFNFYYYLKGIDTDWLPSKGNNSATYTSLPHGEYTFQVFVIDKLTGKKSEPTSLSVIITPPWWLSIKAKIIYSFISLIIILLITKAMLRRREIQQHIALSEERLKLSLWGSGDEMWDWDIETGEIFRSNIWGTLDFPQDGRRSGKIGEESNIHPIDQPRVQKALNDHFSNITDHFEIAYRVKGRNNQWMWILDRAKIVERDQKDYPVRMTGTIKDINNIKQVEEQLKLFARAIENISEGMFILNQEYVFVEVNEACCEIASCSRDNFMQQKLAFTRYPESYSEQIRTALRQQGRWSGEIEAKKGDNNFFLMELTIDAIYNEQGETSHYVGVFSDITRRKQHEEELRKLTNNDLLTGLPNRSSLQVTLSNLVKKDIHHTLMVLDLDNFKRINDSLGHQVGDELLISVAERIKKTIPNHASLYRLGGDEFALLIDQNPDIGSSAMIASNIIQSLKPAFELNDENLVLGISIGVVLYPEDEQNEQALLRKADIAMYHAKSAGGNRYQFYSESLNQNALRQLEVENLIREALKEDYFEVYYQPKVDLKNDCLAGMEALVRLNHPKHGIIPPNDFIPLAEENGLIVEIGDVVLRKACFAANKWLEQGLFNGRVAVNLSSRQFALTDLQQRIESILRLTKLPAKHLELEITEGTVIKNPEKAIKVMQQLAKMGVSLALDDFGTGYSSLSYLKRFPINCLKIDKSFVDDIDKSDRDLKMVDSIITIAHNMGLTVVGEGVEENAQLNILKALNCEEIQGYIFSKPVPEDDFEQLLATDTDKRSKLKTHKSNKN
ncbi:EAL domain-containing protein [Shewanella subflava]|uniref:EAL domain-containing protein n=1 Tax=Shewanella subflava TaxID=2986476 RepID=A0ABT3I509_9GAMM|nr:EAL domain-containing protein [Shewanella subflava]MCW3171154.1 EAL domain-containing protein [Shewanella subflava]